LNPSIHGGSGQWMGSLVTALQIFLVAVMRGFTLPSPGDPENGSQHCRYDDGRFPTQGDDNTNRRHFVTDNQAGCGWPGTAAGGMHSTPVSPEEGTGRLRQLKSTGARRRHGTSSAAESTSYTAAVAWAFQPQLYTASSSMFTDRLQQEYI
jgi:hypothetical protein